MWVLWYWRAMDSDEVLFLPSSRLCDALAYGDLSEHVDPKYEQVLKK
jgi:hypothetical protein